MTILRDLVVAVGKWTANDGTEKTRWRTIGQMHEGSKGKYITLDPAFNLAAVPLKEGDYRVYVNLFAPIGSRPQEVAQPGRLPDADTWRLVAAGSAVALD